MRFVFSKQIDYKDPCYLTAKVLKGNPRIIFEIHQVAVSFELYCYESAFDFSNTLDLII